ncbi:MAG TPA: MOSC domain-containing protein [Kiloniellales bacterium]
MGELVAIARKAKSRAPMEEIDRVRVTQEAGIAGDYRGRRPRNRQVTVLSADVWDRVCGELGAEIAWTTRRANLLVRGVALPRRAGARLTVGALELEVGMETAPCERMDEQHQGLTAALKPDWRGGVCCRVLNDAEIRIGDPVTVEG